MEKKKTIEERMAALEAIVNGDSVKRDMIRKAKQYTKPVLVQCRVKSLHLANGNIVNARISSFVW